MNKYYNITPNSLEGKVAIVTGGGRGIGRAIALELAAAGAAVTVTSRSPDQLEEVVAEIEQSGGKALAVPADVADREAVDRVVTETVDKLGPIDILVNNAGAASAVGPVWEVDPDVWWRDIEINVRGTMLFSRAVLPSMIARGSGRILNVATGAAARPVTFMSSYSCAKAAVLRFTDTLAAETREHGIWVFAIAPSYVRTQMTEALIGTEIGRKYAPRFENMPEHMWQPPERAGALATYLAMGHGDALTGRFISVLDDLPEMIAKAADIEQQDTYQLRLRK